MSPSNLLDLITAYGTRKHCSMGIVREQYGSHNIQEMWDDLKLLEKQGKRKVWVALLAALVLLVAIAVNCMDCLRL